MKATLSSFTFVGYQANIQKGIVIFSYEMQIKSKRFEFHEELSFKPPITSTIQALKPSLESLLLMLGISYWKTYCPATIIIKPFTLTRKQAEFWNLVYTKGLGEFFYKNKIDFLGLVQFPYEDSEVEKTDSSSYTPRSLVLFGGGKDSIVSAELLKDHNKDYSLLAINSVQLQRRIADQIGKNLIEIQRKLDPKLFELNTEEGVYNGHIPISAVYAFISLFAAIIYDYQYCVASNEESSNYGNISYLGQGINHQWSKSFEFEKEIHAYISKYISKHITYFSLLRPIHEIEIVRLFSKYKEYFPLFSSCNRNFKLSGSINGPLWCGRCPKCAFVFLLLSAFLPKVEVVHIFKKNLFADESLLMLYKELLGSEGFKPFECVGTPEESLWAFAEMLKRGEYNDDSVVKSMKSMRTDIQDPHVFDVRHNNLIPNEFKDVISSL